MTFPTTLTHGPITKIADGVYTVRGGFPMGPGIVISRTMTIVAADDGLAIFNALRLSDAAEAELERLGKVKHLVKLSDSHGLDEPYFAHRYKPEVWAMTDAKHRRGVSSTRAFGPEGPITGGKVFGYPGTSGWRESGYYIPHAGGTYISCDALQNHADMDGASLLARIMTPLMGFKGGVIVAPMWRKYQKVSGVQVRNAFAEVSAQPFANLITGHGPAVVGGADARVRAAIEAASL